VAKTCPDKGDYTCDRQAQRCEGTGDLTCSNINKSGCSASIQCVSWYNQDCSSY
jgi:hypothetical protein